MRHDAVGDSYPTHGIAGPGYGVFLPGETPHASLMAVRRLTEQARSDVTRLFGYEPGFSLFLASNLRVFGLESAFVRYWGAFEGQELVAVLMLIGRRVALYAPPGTPTVDLAQFAVQQGIDFTMGRADLVDTILAALPPNSIERREEHVFAELPLAGDVPSRVAAPAEARLRRATLQDLEALTQLYYGSAGYEEFSLEQVRQSVAGRLRTMRTYVAETTGQLVSVASTSAEVATAAMIGGVWTAPEERGRGYSTAVVSELARELVREGRQPYLFYLIDNQPAARVYARIGFQAVGRWSVAHLRLAHEK